MAATDNTSPLGSNHAYLMTIQSLLSKLRSLESATAEMGKALPGADDVVSTAYKVRVLSLEAQVKQCTGVGY